MAQKQEKYSYSKIDLYSQCGFKYKLKYIDGHYLYSDSIATELGTLIHATEEHIANSIKAGEPIDYISLKNKLIKARYELEHKYPKDFNEADKAGRFYKDKIYDYLNKGIYRLENFLFLHPNYEVVATEQAFTFEFKGVIFHGYIDRIFRNKANNTYIVQDIKTYTVPVDKKDLATPLQFVVYVLAMKELFGVEANQVQCAYDLPFCDCTQDAGTPGYMTRGVTKITKLLEGISEKEYEPKPSPLCHWCEFCPTNPNQPEGGKNLCPYHSNWTRAHKDFSVAASWRGIENHESILENYIKQQDIKAQLSGRCNQ